MAEFKQEDFILILVALIFPPGSVLLVSGLGLDVILNVLLLLFGWIPAALHAFWIIYQKIQKDQRWHPTVISTQGFKQGMKPRSQETQLTFPTGTNGRYPWERRAANAAPGDGGQKSN